MKFWFGSALSRCPCVKRIAVVLSQLLQLTVSFMMMMIGLDELRDLSRSFMDSIVETFRLNAD